MLYYYININIMNDKQSNHKQSNTETVNEINILI